MNLIKILLHTKHRNNILPLSVNLMCEATAVHEFRIDYGPGYRIYFGRAGAKMILLLCGGSKRSQQKDIERAKLYWKEYMEES
jgi:putative addiction module killer protein